ncbi:deoxyhypusine synthase-like [Thalassophryne amazonica]|uniref:deoxyhypusine synthase-like n=1 Tax=Thalassophryne amazonica TaxID=390379 RepID=UPI001471E300|nr:deoxyhypusine synthase-like [Thalassophryne amazonica]
MAFRDTLALEMAKHIHRVNHSYKKSVPLPEYVPKIRGYDFNQGVDHRALLQTYISTGFQATRVGLAINEINTMIEKRQQSLQVNRTSEEDPSTCPCLQSFTIFLGCTANIITCGVRETIRYLAEHRMVDVFVMAAGGMEEDLMKCLAPFYLGEFSMPGKDLFKKGINRNGDILIPNDNYSLFEAWMMPILKQMLWEQNNKCVCANT